MHNTCMTTEQFAYWMQGFFEIQNPKILTATQTQMIKDHLELVFKKETPVQNPPPDRILKEGKQPKKPIQLNGGYNSGSRVVC